MAQERCLVYLLFTYLLYNIHNKDTKDTKMNDILFEELPEEEQMGEESTIGESLAMQFYYGNYTASVKKMVELDVSTSELCDYLEENASDMNMLLSDDYYYGGCFTYSFWIELSADFARKGK